MTRPRIPAIIGGSGLDRLPCFSLTGTLSVSTPYHREEVSVWKFDHLGQLLYFLPRHGPDHHLAPHQINYRANIHALSQLGVTDIIAVNAVGGIHGQLGPGSVAIPEQLIDYTSNRESSFFSGGAITDMHVDFTHPFSHEIRHLLLQAVAEINEQTEEPRTVLNHGVYGCTQGPRLETAAEILRLKRDGCDMVGMTAMPEAVLARELGIAYGCLALSVNWGAGLGVNALTVSAMQTVLEQGMSFVQQVLSVALGRYQQLHGGR